MLSYFSGSENISAIRAGKHLGSSPPLCATYFLLHPPPPPLVPLCWMSGVERRKEAEGAEGGRREINEEEKDDIVNLFTYTEGGKGRGREPHPTPPFRRRRRPFQQSRVREDSTEEKKGRKKQHSQKGNRSPRFFSFTNIFVDETPHYLQLFVSFFFTKIAELRNWRLIRPLGRISPSAWEWRWRRPAKMGRTDGRTVRVEGG